MFLEKMCCTKRRFTFGETTLISSFRNRNLPTSLWNLFPQFFIQVSRTSGGNGNWSRLIYKPSNSKRTTQFGTYQKSLRGLPLLGGLDLVGQESGGELRSKRQFTGVRFLCCSRNRSGPDCSYPSRSLLSWLQNAWMLLQSVSLFRGFVARSERIENTEKLLSTTSPNHN